VGSSLTQHEERDSVQYGDRVEFLTGPLGTTTSEGAGSGRFGQHTVHKGDHGVYRADISKITREPGWHAIGIILADGTEVTCPAHRAMFKVIDAGD